MDTNEAFAVIQTEPERCRMCYTCVRECPAKAIRIMEGQARIVHERCIGCGNCVRVCSQNAKRIVDTINDVSALLSGSTPVAAIVAPSFPAEFFEFSPVEFVGKIRSLGFRWVHEVAFGADLVAKAYRKLIDESATPYIATSCPAVVSFVEKYAPALIKHLAPLVSPMVAMARVVRQLHGKDVRVVFIGPCTAKKGEGSDSAIEGDVDGVLTYRELRTMFAGAKRHTVQSKATDFDPPHAGNGALFPLCGGMLQAAGITEDLTEELVVQASGRSSFVEAIREFEQGALTTRLLELLACEGCIMGVGMECDAPLFKRRSLVSRYVKNRMAEKAHDTGKDAVQDFKDVDLSRHYTNRDQRLDQPDEQTIEQILIRLGKKNPADELNCGACGYETCREHAVAIHKKLAESEMCLPYTIDRLNRTIGELGDSNRQLASAQEALMQSERLASMGQLAAGIAHEVNNPLGIVLMYAHLLADELPPDGESAADARLIAEQADRCKKIVAGLLHFARQNRVLRQPTDIPELVRRCGQMVMPPANIKLTFHNAMANPTADVDSDQLTQVLSNLISNAYHAMPEGGVLELSTLDTPETVQLTVRDSGLGIPPDIRQRIFEPFFTTKQFGVGTGLGLAVTYGIIKMHKGDIRVRSNHDSATGPTGTTFEIELPRKDEE